MSESFFLAVTQTDPGTENMEIDDLEALNDDNEVIKESSSNVYPFLSFAGLNPGGRDFVKSSLQTIKDSNLNQESLTNGLIMELWSLVQHQFRGKQDSTKIPPDKISRRQFSEIVGCFVFKWTPESLFLACAVSWITGNSESK